MLLVGLGILAAAYGLMLYLDRDAAAMVTLGGYVGMSAVNWTARPSYIVIEEAEVSAATKALQEIDYRYVPERDHWVPPIPRWLRWTFNFVKFEQRGTVVRVSAPANLLRYLSAQLA
jgi:hypothetical protein